MRWEIIDNKPKVGEKRIKTKFAWFPTIVLSKLTMTDHVIWLELYVEEQEYQKFKFGYDYNWHEKWQTVSKTIYK